MINQTSGQWRCPLNYRTREMTFKWLSDKIKVSEEATEAEEAVMEEAEIANISVHIGP